MPGTAETGRVWLCPECRKHVPARKNACACGFDRTTVPVQMQEVNCSGRAAEPAWATDGALLGFDLGACHVTHPPI